MKRTFWITLSAALLAARMSGGAGYVPEDLNTLDELADRTDIVALREFVKKKPSVLSADDALSVSLHEALETQDGFVDSLNEEVARRGRGIGRGGGWGRGRGGGKGRGRGKGHGGGGHIY